MKLKATDDFGCFWMSDEGTCYKLGQPGYMIRRSFLMHCDDLRIPGERHSYVIDLLLHVIGYWQGTSTYCAGDVLPRFLGGELRIDLTLIIDIVFFWTGASSLFDIYIPVDSAAFGLSVVRPNWRLFAIIVVS